MVLVLLIVTKCSGRQSPEEIRRVAHKEIEVPEAAAPVCISLTWDILCFHVKYICRLRLNFHQLLAK